MTRATAYARKHEAERNAWAAEFARCWLCGRGDSWLPLQTHEIFPRGRARNSWAFTANYFRVCNDCHGQVIPTLSMEAQLAYKLANDAERFTLQPFREVAAKFTGRPTRLVDEAEILEELRQMFIRGEIHCR